jgi:hypothetical protein
MDGSPLRSAHLKDVYMKPLSDPVFDPRVDFDFADSQSDCDLQPTTGSPQASSQQPTFNPANENV